MFLGFVPISSGLTAPVVARNGAGAPADAAAAPTYRVYGPNGVMQAGTGSVGFQDQGNITGASNAGPIVVTSANHGLSTGTELTISGVTGNSAANGTWIVTVIDANTFSLNGSNGNGAYTGGGTWHVTGLYSFLFTPTAANGFLQGVTYTAYFTWTISGTTYSDAHTFTVV